MKEYGPPSDQTIGLEARLHNATTLLRGGLADASAALTAWTGDARATSASWADAAAAFVLPPHATVGLVRAAALPLAGAALLITLACVCCRARRIRGDSVVDRPYEALDDGAPESPRTEMEAARMAHEAACSAVADASGVAARGRQPPSSPMRAVHAGPAKQPEDAPSVTPRAAIGLAAEKRAALASVRATTENAGAVAASPRPRPSPAPSPRVAAGGTPRARPADANAAEASAQEPGPSAEALALLLPHLKKIKLFGRLTQPQLQLLAAAMEEQTFSRGEWIFEQGAKGDTFYIISRGEAEILQSSSRDGTQKKLAGLKAWSSFGEIALLKSLPRSASVRATTASVVCLCISRDGFQRALGTMLEDMVPESFKLDKAELHAALGRVKVFADFSAAQLEAVCGALEERHYKKGDWIFQQGDAGDAFYVVQSGKASVLRKDPGVGERILKNLKAWDTFGERAAFLGKEKRYAGVRVITTSMSCLTINRGGLENALGPLADELLPAVQGVQTVQGVQAPTLQQPQAAPADMSAAQADEGADRLRDHSPEPVRPTPRATADVQA